MTGGNDRTDDGDIALKSEAKRRDGIGESQASRVRQGKAEQSKAQQGKANRIANHTKRRGREAGRQAEIGSLTGWAPTFAAQDRARLGTGRLVGEVLKPK